MNKICERKLDTLYRKLNVFKKMFLGYPSDADFDYSALYRFLEFPLNNIGDPSEKSAYCLQTKDFEREVLKFFAELFHIKNHWGYITNGGTEGNLYGLYLAREILPKASVFFSEDTHYSIRKNVHLLRMKNSIIKSNSNGEMDYEDFTKKIKKHKSAVVVANIGTTMKGAVDDVCKISGILEKNKINYYIHADAALYGMILPFISEAPFDFRSKISSISVSGHKFVGSPIPCGVVLVRKELVKTLQDYIEYINAHDTTLSGSRDAFTPLVFWYRIKTIGLEGFKKQVQYSNELAEFLVLELKRIGWPGVERSYITVRFQKPPEQIVKKWELAVFKNMAHVICLPHQTKEQLMAFITELELIQKNI
ncbi:MAG: histidine decarboxylase [archaeon]